MPSLEEVLKIKVPQKTFEFQGYAFTLRLLNSRETEECWEAVRFLDDTSKSYAFPKQILARAITEINGEQISAKTTKEEEEKITVSDMKGRIINENIKGLDSASPSIIVHFYYKYSDLKKEEDKIVEDIKKKEKIVKVVTTGKSQSLLE
jgi:hypothetical protein